MCYNLIMNYWSLRRHYRRNPRKFRILAQQQTQKFPGALWREQPEEIGTADSRDEAKYLVREFKMAYGSGWRVWFELKGPNQRFLRRY